MAILSGRNCRVIVNGQDLRGCRSVTITADVNEAVLVTVELFASPRVELDAAGVLVFTLDPGPVSGRHGAVAGEPDLEIINLWYRKGQGPDDAQSP